MAVPFRVGPILSRAARAGLLRPRAAAVVVIMMSLVVTIFAQRRRTGNQLRALAVVEFPENGEPRLVPVTILVEDRYYDAGVYKASPVPMSLQPGTVYEARRAGAPAGLFTVTEPAQLLRNWIAGGNWKPHGTEEVEKEQTAPEPSGAPADVDAPPVLRRGSPKDATKPEPAPQEESKNTPAAPASQPTQDGAPDGPPVLRRPQSAPESTAAAPEQSPTAQSGQEQASAQDPNRPRLRRNTEPGANQAESLKDALPSPEKAPWKIKEAFPAISDTKTDEVRNYLFDWRPDEKANFQREAEALATTALARYAETRARMTAGPLEDVEVQAFNLDFSNIPYIVLMATARPASGSGAANNPNPDFRFHVTLVARPSPTRELRQVLGLVTDSSRLDIFPEFQLIDAVDADGDGRAELLFAEITDLGRAYKLYRLIGDNASELFTSVPIRNSSYRP